MLDLNDDAETWLTGVVNQAALLATDIAQLTDYLTTQRIADPANVINSHADALEEQLRQLETAADTVMLVLSAERGGSEGNADRGGGNSHGGHHRSRIDSLDV